MYGNFPLHFSDHCDKEEVHPHREYCWSGVRRQTDLMSSVKVPWMRDRRGSRVWVAAESFKVSHVAPAVVCKEQKAGTTPQRRKVVCPKSYNELVTVTDSLK